MTSLEQQAVTLFSQGADIHEIANSLDVSPQVVELALTRQKELDETLIPKDDFDDIRRGLIEMAKTSASEEIRARLGIFLWEQREGKASLKNTPGGINLLQINNVIQAGQNRALEVIKNLRKSRAGAVEATPSEGRSQSEAERVPSTS